MIPVTKSRSLLRIGTFCRVFCLPMGWAWRAEGPPGIPARDEIGGRSHVEEVSEETILSRDHSILRPFAF